MTIDLPVPHIRSVTIFMLLNENETFSNMYLLDNRDLPEIQETSSPVHSPLGRQVRSGDRSIQNGPTVTGEAHCRTL